MDVGLKESWTYINQAIACLVFTDEEILWKCFDKSCKACHYWRWIPVNLVPAAAVKQVVETFYRFIRCKYSESHFGCCIIGLAWRIFTSAYSFYSLVSFGTICHLWLVVPKDKDLCWCVVGPWASLWDDVWWDVLPKDIGFILSIR